MAPQKHAPVSDSTAQCRAPGAGLAGPIACVAADALLGCPFSLSMAAARRQRSLPSVKRATAALTCSLRRRGNAMPTDIKLDQQGGNWLILEGSVLKTTASDLMLDSPGRRRGGSSPHRRALVHDSQDGLTINFAGDYPGGVTVTGNLAITGNLAVTRRSQPRRHGAQRDHREPAGGARFDPKNGRRGRPSPGCARKHRRIPRGPGRRGCHSAVADQDRGRRGR